MTASLARSRFDMGRVLSGTFRSVGRNWRVFGALALILCVAPALLLNWFKVPNVSRLWGEAAVNSEAGTVGVALTLLIYLVALLVMEGAVVHGVVVDLGERRPRFRECLSTGVRVLLPMIGMLLMIIVAIAAWLLSVIGLSFLGFAGLASLVRVLGILGLLVGGPLLGVRWLVTIPALVVERRGVIGSFRRSAELTRVTDGPCWD